MAEMMYDQLGRIASRTNPQLWRVMFSGVPVYELSNIVQVVHGMEFDNDKIPKRPPHERMFCEWDAKVGSVNVRQGVLLFKGNECDVMHKNIRMVHTYGMIRFIIIRNGNKNWSGNNKLIQFEQNEFVRFDEDYTHFGYGVTQTDTRETDLCEVTIKNNNEFTISSIGLWSMILSFSLLHCKNIIGDDVKPQKQPKKFKERGYPPFCSYKVLKVEVPGKAHVSERPDDLGDDSDPKRRVRFHLCRGHFKHMTHERFKNRGGWYWVPAHWKGAKELGTVVKDYKLTPAKTEAVK